jgi:type IV pilus assembly PilM-like protein
MSRGLGIEIDTDGVRALAVEGGKKPRILAFAERLIDPSDERPWADRARDAIKAAVAEAGGARGRIAASIDSGDAILRELHLPFTNDEQIRKTVRFELEQHVHNHAIEDLVVDFVKTASTEKGSQILVAAVPKTLIEERLKLLESAGADPAVLDLDALALFNTLVEAGAVKDDAPLLALYGGSRFTKFLLVENRRPRAIRTIRYSAPAPENAPSIEVTGQGELEGTEPLIVVDTDAAPHENILAIEAGRFLMASSASSAPSRILIMGRLDAEAVAGPLTEATGAPVEPFDILAPFGPVADSARGHDRRLPVALGLALKAANRDSVGTDFRREEYSYSKKFETVKSSALVLTALAAMLLALLALHLHFKSVDLQSDIDTVLKFQAQVVADAVEHNPTKIPPALQDDPSKSFEFLKKRIDELSKKLGAGDHPIERSTLNLLSRIWKSLEQFHREQGNRKTGDQPFYFLVDAINATQDPGRGTAMITMSGLASHIQVAEGFLQKLRGSTPFSSGWSIEPGRYPPVKENTQYTFTFRKEK